MVRGISRRTPPSDMWCRSPAPRRWLCPGCWTVRTGSRPPAPPAPGTTPEHLTADQSGKETLKNLNEICRISKNGVQIHYKWDLLYRRNNDARCNQKVSRSSLEPLLSPSWLKLQPTRLKDALSRPHTAEVAHSRKLAHTHRSEYSHDAQRRTYRTRQAAKVGRSPCCQNQAVPLLPASPVVQIGWQSDWAARTREAKEGHREEVVKKGKRERGRERKEGRLSSAPRSHAQIIVNAAQKASRLDVRSADR